LPYRVAQVGASLVGALDIASYGNHKGWPYQGVRDASNCAPVNDYEF